MSHLSILPTVLRDAHCLASSLEAMGFTPRWGGVVRGFDPDQQPVLIRVALSSGLEIGWQRQHDGRLALVGDLQRLSQTNTLSALLGRLTRTYAAHRALIEAQLDPALATATVLASPPVLEGPTALDDLSALDDPCALDDPTALGGPLGWPEAMLLAP